MLASDCSICSVVTHCDWSRLEELLYINHLASNVTGEQIKVYTFYHKSRKDGLSTRESRDWGKCRKLWMKIFYRQLF